MNGDIMTELGEYILLYDGNCRFCNRWVQWVVDRDNDRVFRFAALESDFSKDLHEHLKIKRSADTIAIVDVEQLLLYSTESANSDLIMKFRSDAVGCLFLRLQPNALLYRLIEVSPKVIANIGYNCVAAIRKFLPVPSCRLYNKEEKQLFLNDVDFTQFISLSI